MQKIKIFVSYSHEDEEWVSATIPGTYRLIPWLEKQLKSTAEIWTDHALKELPGESYNQLITEKILDADIALLLISQDFVSSEYIMRTELPLIKQQYDDEKIKIIPLLITNVSNQGKEKISWIFDLQTYPNDTKPLISFLKDAAEWSDVKVEILNGINNKIISLKNRTNPPSNIEIFDTKPIVNEEYKLQNSNISAQKELSENQFDDKVVFNIDQAEIENEKKAIDEVAEKVKEQDLSQSLIIQPILGNINVGKETIEDNNIDSTDTLPRSFNKSMSIKPGKKIILGASILILLSFLLYLMLFKSYEKNNSKTENEKINVDISNKNNGDYSKEIATNRNADATTSNGVDANNSIKNTIDKKGDYNKPQSNIPSAKQNANSIKADSSMEYKRMGISYADKGEYDKAITAYQKAISFKPEDADAYYNMGISYKDKGDYDKAIAAYQNAISIKPEDADAYYNMGISYKDKGDIDKAIAAYQNAISIKPDHAYAYYNMGNLYKNKGDYDKAISAYQNAILIKPDYAKAYYNMGNLYKNKGDYDKAISAYQNAISIKSDDADTYYNMGCSYDDKGEYDKAIAAYQKAISIKPDHVNAYYNMGISYKKKGDYAKQKECYKQAAKLGDKDCQKWLKDNNETW